MREDAVSSASNVAAARVDQLCRYILYGVTKLLTLLCQGLQDLPVEPMQDHSAVPGPHNLPVQVLFCMGSSGVRSDCVRLQL